MYSFSSFFAKYLAYIMIFLRTFVVLNLILWKIIKYAKKKAEFEETCPITKYIHYTALTNINILNPSP